MSDNEGAKHWGMVLEDLKDRGVEDVLVFCTDDLKGFSEATSETFANSIIQKCIVHKVRSSTRFIDDKDVKKIRTELRTVYASENVQEALIAFATFSTKWESKYPRLIKTWSDNWDELFAFMDFPKDMRRMIYSTNPVEALHRIIRKFAKAKAAWSSEVALLKQIYLSLKHNEKSWKRQALGWKSIQRALLNKFGERVAKHIQS